MFSIICMEFFGLEPAQASYLLSFFGLLLMVSECRAHRARLVGWGVGRERILSGAHAMLLSRLSGLAGLSGLCTVTFHSLRPLPASPPSWGHGAD